MPTCAIISFRLGGIDGVSKVADIYREIFDNLGFDTYTIAGSNQATRKTEDIEISGLDIEDENPPDRAELEAALAPADLVVVENLCTIPLNLPVSLLVADVLKGRPAIMHHHDPPWQRKEFTHITELPIDDPSWLHIVINKITQAQMAEKNIKTECIYNPFRIERFTPEQELAKRQKVRRQLEIDEDELLVAHPVRAIPSKNIETATKIAADLKGTYWLTGPTESFQDYRKELSAIFDSVEVECIHKPAELLSDIYLASDLIVFPSSWEGFGMPPVEAAIYKRHVLVGDYPVAEELMTLGFKWFSKSSLDELKNLLLSKDASNVKQSKAILKNNFKVAQKHLSVEKIQAQIKKLIKQFGF